MLTRAKEGDEAAREVGFLICGELYLFWHIRGKHISAKDAIESFLSTSESQHPTRGKCKALITASLASWALGKFKQGIEEALAGYAIAKELHAELEMAEANLMLGLIYLMVDMDLAKKYAKEGEKRCRELGNIPSVLGFVLWIQGLMNKIEGDWEKSKMIFNEALNIQLKIGDREGGGLSLAGLAHLEVLAGNLDGAIEIYKQSLASFEAIRDRPEEARILGEMAWTYLSLENTVAARKCALDSIEAHQKVGSDRGVGIALIGLAAIESVEHHPERAIKIATASKQFTEQEGILYEYGEDFSCKVYIDNAKKELTIEELEKATNEGSKLSLNEVVELSNEYLVSV